MPNHYTTIALCTPAWSFDPEAFNARMEGFSLCQHLRPVPAGMENTVMVRQGCRRWTARQDANYNSTPIPDTTSQQWLREHGATNGLDWQIANWGTKWGDYDWRAMSCLGDGKPAVISFVSAWSPPSILDAIAEWLAGEYGFERVHWIGADPYDDSIVPLGEQRFALTADDEWSVRTTRAGRRALERLQPSEK